MLIGTDRQYLKERTAMVSRSSQGTPTAVPGIERDQTEVAGQLPVGRRAAIVGALAALARLTLAPGSAAAFTGDLPLDRDDFVELSRRLCDLSLKAGSLSDELQAALLDVEGRVPDRLARLAELVASAPPADVDRLVAQSDLKDLAEAIVAAWYTGMVGPAQRPRVVTHEDALAWRATGYAKAPGTCGAYGEWTERPTPTRAPTAPSGESKR